MADQEKNKMGRPTLYSPELCEKAIEYLKEGASIEELGLELDVGYTTIYRWMEQHEDFRQAVKKGREYSQGWWMKEAREALRDGKFNSTLWYMNMKNRFGWSDKQESTHNVTVSEAKQKVRDADSEYKY